MEGIQDWELKLAKYSALTLATFLTVNTALHPIMSLVNGSIDSEDKTVVLSNDYNPKNDEKMFSGGWVDYFMYPPVMLRQNLRGRHVDWYSNATKGQVLSALQDPDYQNIVLIGHGGNASYNTAGGSIGVRDLYNLDIPIREGEFVQHTCGQWQIGVTLRNYLYPNSDSGNLGFDNRIVSPYENFATAWLSVPFD